MNPYDNQPNPIAANDREESRDALYGLTEMELAYYDTEMHW